MYRIFRLLYWGPAFLWMSLIYQLSASTLDHKPFFTFPGMDKLAHMGIFAVLSILPGSVS